MPRGRWESWSSPSPWDLRYNQGVILNRHGIVNHPMDLAKDSQSHQLPKQRGERIRLATHAGAPDAGDAASVRTWLESRPRPWAVDLFCGAGGLSLGLEDAGFTVVAAADSDPNSIETHAANIQGLTWMGDLADPSGFIRQLDEWGIGEVDLVAGGPPCQPFSRAGTSKIGSLVRAGHRSALDRRADLWESFFAIADRLSPRAILFENVPDFAEAQDGALLIALMDELRIRGYDVHLQMLSAWRYRVPQHRSRLFVTGIMAGGNFKWPKSRGRMPNVGQAIGDLPVVPAGTRMEVQDYHRRKPRSILVSLLRRGLRGKEARRVHDHVTRAVREDDADIYRDLGPGQTYLDVPEHKRRYRSDIFNDKYVRLSFDGLSRTITAHIAKDGYWYIHPSEDRTLSIREAARIQTFPDRFRFAGYPSSRYRQIGNAVPPLLAFEIGNCLKRTLTGDPGQATNGEAHQDWAFPFRTALLWWFNSQRRDFPWRNGNQNPWQVLMIEMCLRRTRAEQVAQVADSLLSLGGTPGSFLDNIDELEPHLAHLGLNQRSDNLHEAALFVRDEMGGRIPDTWHGLRAITGVGDYIASAVLCFAFNRPSVLMDTNTRRIARRVLGEGQNHQNWRLRHALWELAGPQGADTRWNQALLDLGAKICTARVPRCGECPVQAHCATGVARLESEASI